MDGNQKVNMTTYYKPKTKNHHPSGWRLLLGFGWEGIQEPVFTYICKAHPVKGYRMDFTSGNHIGGEGYQFRNSFAMT